LRGQPTLTSGTVSLTCLCPACGSTRAVVPLKSSDTSMVHCSDCNQALGFLGDVRRDLAEKARTDARSLANRIYRDGRGRERKLKPK
jgi:hypothetical protein